MAAKTSSDITDYVPEPPRPIALVPIAQPHSEVMVVLQMIERASNNPNSDPDKMGKLFELRERVREQLARDDYVAALSRVQSALPKVQTRGRITYSGGASIKYAKWEDIHEAIMPVLAENGFTLTFEYGTMDKFITVTAILDHIGGHSRRNTATLPADNSGGKTGVQGYGSTYSYGERYSTMGLVNFVTGGADDDGNAGKFQAISAEQLAELARMAAEAGSDPDKLAMAMGVDNLHELPVSKFERAKQALEAKQVQNSKNRSKP